MGLEISLIPPPPSVDFNEISNSLKKKKSQTGNSASPRKIHLQRRQDDSISILMDNRHLFSAIRFFCSAFFFKCNQIRDNALHFKDGNQPTIEWETHLKKFKEKNNNKNIKDLRKNE